MLFMNDSLQVSLDFIFQTVHLLASLHPCQIRLQNIQDQTRLKKFRLWIYERNRCQKQDYQFCCCTSNHHIHSKANKMKNRMQDTSSEPASDVGIFKPKTSFIHVVRRYFRSKERNLCSISTHTKLAKLISTKSIYISGVRNAKSVP